MTRKKKKASLNDFSWLVARRTRRSLVASLVTVFVLVTCHLPLVTVFALAQSQTTGRIAGTVKDPNGARIVGAAVTVTNLATAEERKDTTDTEGYYAVPLLSPGTYRVRITASGFNPALDVARVVITETTTVNAELAVAGLSAETVTVNAAPFIQAGGPQLGRVVDSRAVAELPLATRNFLQILALSPGAFADLPDNTAVGRNSQSISVNGARRTQNNFEINGIDANRLDFNNATSVAVPAPETIQEFKVQTSLYDATFGRGAGGSVQAVTRSGTNEFHGAAYEYFRDDAFNANNPFLKAAGVQRPTLKRNVFGGLLGGPVKSDKAFFFVSYQGTRERNGASDNSLTSSILIAPGLTDDRSEQTLLATFRPLLASGQPAPSIHPAALALLNIKLPGGGFLIPTPQADGRYSGSAISTYREDQFNANVDNRAGEKDWLAVKFFFSNAPQFAALPNSAANVPGFGADRKNDNRLFSVQNIHTFGARTVNEARAGYSFIRDDSFGRHPVKDSDVGIRRANASAYPGLGLIRIGAAEALGIGNVGTNALAIGNAGTFVDLKFDNSAITLVDILSITRGRHNVRTGGGVIFYRTNVTSNNNRRGQIVFQDSASGLNKAFANFLLGQATSSLNAEGINTRFMRAADYSLFLQDDWKFSERLTFNLGLRYELDLPPYETRGVLGTFDPALYRPRMEVDSRGNPVGPPVGGFVQAGNVIPEYDLADVPNVGRRVLTSVDPNNFGPRVGLAYSPLDSGRLVMRGGYGIFYSRPSTVHIINTTNSPPTYALGRRAGAPVRLEDPFVPLPSQDQFPAFVPGVLLSSSTFDRRMRTAYFYQYNASLQYALSHDLLLEVAYVGTRGHNLMRNVRINQARLASPQHPIVNAVTGQVITTNTPNNALLRAPFQGADIAGFQQFQYTAESAYNSLQMSLTRRLSKGVQLLASYTYAKSLDNASGQAEIDPSTILGNQFDNRANRGVSDFDRTHRFVLSYLWDLPRPAFAERSTAGRLLLSDWQVAGIMTAMSGLPIDIVDSNAGSFYFGGNNGLSRPSWAPGATRQTAMSNVPAGYYFNPLAFVRPVVQPGQPIPSSNGTAIAGDGPVFGTDIGNVGRNVLRGPRQSNVDFSVIKRMAIGESKNIELRAEFFNLFNHVNFANPVSNFNAVPVSSIDRNTGQIINPADLGDFGRINSTSNNPRLIQLAVKFNY